MVWQWGHCAHGRSSGEHPWRQRWHPGVSHHLPASRCCHPPQNNPRTSQMGRHPQNPTPSSPPGPQNPPRVPETTTPPPPNPPFGYRNRPHRASARPGYPKPHLPPPKRAPHDLSCMMTDPGGVPTSTDDAGVLVVAAVVPPPAQVEAVGQARLAAGAPHVVQQHGPAAEPEKTEDGGGDGGTAAQLAAHHLGVGEVPVVVADGAPGAAVPHLHPPAAAPVAVRQPHAGTCGRATAQPRRGGGP